jgi:hypothetical protein
MIDYSSEYGFWFNEKWPMPPNTFFQLQDSSMGCEICLGPPAKSKSGRIDIDCLYDQIGIYKRNFMSKPMLNEALRQYEQVYEYGILSDYRDMIAIVKEAQDLVGLLKSRNPKLGNISVKNFVEYAIRQSYEKAIKEEEAFNGGFLRFFGSS